MIIGKFTKSEDGKLTGFVDTLHGEIALTFVPQSKGAAYQIVTLQGCEVGAAWNKTSSGGKPFISVKLDSPMMPTSISCALFSRDNFDFDYVLVWDRPDGSKKSTQD